MSVNQAESQMVAEIAAASNVLPEQAGRRRTGSISSSASKVSIFFIYFDFCL